MDFKDIRITSVVASRDLITNSIQERAKRERTLDAAETLQWSECPQRLRTEVSSLTRFIVAPDLQQIISNGDPKALDLSTDSLEAQEEDIALYKIEAMELAEELYRTYSAQRPDNAYHHQEHTRQVIDRVENLVRISKHRFTKNQVRELFLAAAGHDVDHHGFARYPDPQGFSVEQHSANITDTYVQKKGLSLRSRLNIYTSIIGTSFWDSKIQPVTRAEKLLQLADYGGYMESLEEWFAQSLAMATENAAVEPPADHVAKWLFEKEPDKAVLYWLEGQSNFIKKILRPAHNRYKQKYVDLTEPWPAESALQEKETAVAELISNINDPSYAPIVLQVRARLAELHQRYSKE